jgi:hypothetical protein
VNILIPDTVFPDDHALERAAAAPLGIVIESAQKAGDLSAEVWSGADALVAHHLMPYDKIIAKAASNVRVLVRVGVGVDNIDLGVWSARGVPVCNVPDYGTGEVADHALALTLSLLRGTVAYSGADFRSAGGCRIRPDANSRTCPSDRGAELSGSRLRCRLSQSVRRWRGCTRGLRRCCLGISVGKRFADSGHVGPDRRAEYGCACVSINQGVDSFHTLAYGDNSGTIKISKIGKPDDEV